MLLVFSKRATATAITLYFCLWATSRAQAHVEWTQTNRADADLLGLYHCDDVVSATSDVLSAVPPLPADLGLTLKQSSGPSMFTRIDSAGPIFDPRSLRVVSAQIAESSATLQHLSGDLTIECWFKWDADFTSQTVRLGLNSGAKLEIVRDLANPANDRFGIRFTHNDYDGAPGFTNWPEIGEEEVPLNEWLHAAVTIQSAGMQFAPNLGHDIYTTGSLARFWFNGHPFGISPFTVNIANMRVHDASKLRVQGLGGPVSLDEVTIWKRDWSHHGQNNFPFGNGRGSGAFNAVRFWSRFD